MNKLEHKIYTFYVHFLFQFFRIEFLHLITPPTPPKKRRGRNAIGHVVILRFCSQSHILITHHKKWEGKTVTLLPEKYRCFSGKEELPVCLVLLAPLLDRRTKGMVGDEIGVLKLKVCHWRSAVAGLQPPSQCFCLVSVPIRSYMRVFHHFLQFPESTRWQN